jgi:aminomethyltransferase
MTDSTPLRTPLDALHESLGARMVEYAGWRLPVRYPAGISSEHLHTRASVSLFDVSHMGQLRVRGTGAAAALEALMPANLVALALGRMRYALLTLDGGGVLDDLMVTREGEDFVLVVNASRRDVDEAHLRAALPADVLLEALDDQAMLALQGPLAAQVLERLAPGAAALAFMQAATVRLHGAVCRVSRSGYTGEDGFEIACAAHDAERVACRLLDESEVAPAGLGARDTLRLEAGLCLYGHELDEHTTPVQATLAWALPKVRRPGGARAGGYPGAQAIEAELAAGPARVRVGLKALGRAPVRDGVTLLDAHGAEIGQVSSGGFGPTVDAPIAMGFVPGTLAVPGTTLGALVRGRALEVSVVPLPFVAHRYAR